MLIDDGFDGTVAVFLWKEQNGFQAQAVMTDGGTTAQQILDFPAPNVMAMSYGSYTANKTEEQSNLTEGIPFFNMVIMSDSSKGLSTYNTDMRKTAAQADADWAIVFMVTLDDK